MRAAKVGLVLVLIWFILLASCITGVLFFYRRDYKTALDHFARQNEATQAELDEFKDKINGFKAALEELSVGFRQQVDNLRQIKEQVNLSEENKQKLLETIEQLKTDYTVVIKELKAKLGQAGLELDSKLEEFGQGATREQTPKEKDKE